MVLLPLSPQRLEDADVVGDRGAAHVEDAAELGSLDLHLAQIGAQLRVLTTDGEGDMRDRVAERLEQSGIEAHVEKTLPNLEDVFVAATRRPRGDNDGAPAAERA